MFKTVKEVNGSDKMEKALGSRDWKEGMNFWGYLVDAKIPEGATGHLYTLALVTNDKGKPVLTGSKQSFWQSVVLNHESTDKGTGKLYGIELGTLIGVTCTGKGKSKAGKETTYFKVEVVDDGKGKVYTMKPTNLKAVSSDDLEIDWDN